MSASATPQCWTFSGINSWSEKERDYIDYVGAYMLKHLPEHPPTRRYASRLGTGRHYPRERKVLGPNAHRKLNREARAVARGEGAYPAIAPGLFHGKIVKVMLVAPKTNTAPPKTGGLHVEIYWAPFDSVPNQRLFRSRQWSRYTRGEGRVWPVSNPEGRGLTRGHGFEGFMKPDRRILKRARRPQRGHKQSRMTWGPTTQRAPNAMDTLRSWLADRRNDYVLLAHSQGTNIALHILRRGYSSSNGTRSNTGR